MSTEGAQREPHDVHLASHHPDFNPDVRCRAAGCAHRARPSVERDAWERRADETAVLPPYREGTRDDMNIGRACWSCRGMQGCAPAATCIYPDSHGRGWYADATEPKRLATPPARKDAILAVLRTYWPETGGQASAEMFKQAQNECADALLRLPPAKGADDA